MKKKALTTTIASAAALFAANPADAGGEPPPDELNNPPTGALCMFDEGVFDAMWDDESGGGTKYGGDLEVTVVCEATCDETDEGVGDFERSESHVLEFDLDRDEEAAFSYSCNGEDCVASLDSEALDEAVAEACDSFFEEAAVECSSDEGTLSTDDYFDFSEDATTFSVKEMKPGRGKGRQSHQKAKVECVDVS
jgi:hypothetical protein